MKYITLAATFLIVILFQVAIISGRTDGQQEIKFIGTAIEYFKGGLGGPYGWRVRVYDVVFGPQLEGYAVEVYLQSVPPPWGYMDPEIKPGDMVEAYGLYSTDSGINHRVSLLGSEDYHLEKVTWLRPVGGYVLPVDKLSLLMPYLVSLTLLGAAVAAAVKTRRRD